MRQEELALKERYMKRIQSAEESCYEALEGLGPVVAVYNDKEVYGYSGAIFATQRFYPLDLAEVVQAQGYGDFITVRQIVEGSPAEAGGLLLGDRLLRVNDVKVPRGDRATTFAVERLKQLWLLDQPNVRVVDRNGVEVKLEIEAEKSVYYSVIVTPFLGDEPVYAEGKALYFSLDLLEGLEEEEFDYICAFALVQNVMKHAKMKGKNEFIGGVLDIAAAVSGINTGGIFGSLGRNAHKAGFLIESDILALYALAQSGVDISGYPDFWEARLTKEGKGVDRVSRERIEAMRQTIAEIAEKRAKGEPIYPTEYLAGDWKLKDWKQTESEEAESL
jgi:hypothetical protein